MTGPLPFPVCPHCGEYAEHVDAQWCGCCGVSLFVNYAHRHVTPGSSLVRTTLELVRESKAVEAAARP